MAHHLYILTFDEYQQFLAVGTGTGWLTKGRAREYKISNEEVGSIKMLVFR